MNKKLIERIERAILTETGYVPKSELRRLCRAIEAEVRAEAKEPVALPIPPAGIIAHPNLGELYDRLQMQQYAMKYAMLHAAPQPPEPCPKCVELDRWLEAGVYFTNTEYEVEVENLNALQAKVAEQSAEIERLTEAVRYRAKSHEVNCGIIAEKNTTIAQQAERIAELERFQSLAFAAHPNIDLDIEAVQKGIISSD